MCTCHSVNTPNWRWHCGTEGLRDRHVHLAAGGYRHRLPVRTEVRTYKSCCHDIVLWWRNSSNRWRLPQGCSQCHQYTCLPAHWLCRYHWGVLEADSHHHTDSYPAHRRCYSWRPHTALWWSRRSLTPSIHTVHCHQICHRPACTHTYPGYRLCGSQLTGIPTPCYMEHPAHEKHIQYWSCSHSTLAGRGRCPGSRNCWSRLQSSPHHLHKWSPQYGGYHR